MLYQPITRRIKTSPASQNDILFVSLTFPFNIESRRRVSGFPCFVDFSIEFFELVG